MNSKEKGEGECIVLSYGFDEGEIAAITYCQGMPPKTNKYGEKYDPLEDFPAFQQIMRGIDKEIRAEIGNGGYMGYCHLYWMVKKRILNERYKIEWRSPAELNPNILYD